MYADSYDDYLIPYYHTANFPSFWTEIYLSYAYSVPMVKPDGTPAPEAAQASLTCPGDSDPISYWSYVSTKLSYGYNRYFTRQGDSNLNECKNKDIQKRGQIILNRDTTVVFGDNYGGTLKTNMLYDKSTWSTSRRWQTGQQVGNLMWPRSVGAAGVHGNSQNAVFYDGSARSVLGGWKCLNCAANHGFNTVHYYRYSNVYERW